MPRPGTPAGRELLIALLYLGIAGGFGAYSLRYDLGSLGRMGVGYFPFLLSVLLAIIGLAVLLRAFRRSGQGRAATAGLRASIGIIGSVALFALLLEPLGLVASLVLLAVGARLADGRFALLSVLANAAVIVALVIIVFVWLLQMSLPLWPSFI